MTLVSVWLNEQRVGGIERFEDETHSFVFDADYLDSPNRPVLGQLFEDRLPDRLDTHGLPLWFKELLPQLHGPLRKAIAQEASIDEYDDLGLLVWLGNDLPGAVRVIAEDAPAYRRAERAPRPVEGVTRTLRVSLAGMQWKVALSSNDHGLSLPVSGEDSSWIAKFQSPSLNALVQVEFATMKWAERAGLNVPEVRVIDSGSIRLLPPSVPVGDGQVLLVRRFDRAAGTRVHMEDFAQVLDRPDQFSGRFEEIARFVASECPVDREELIRRLVFMIASGNADAHLKNWSVVYPDTRTPRLSPAYDQVATVAFPHLPATGALKLSGAELDLAQLEFTHLVPFAEALGLDVASFRESLRLSLRRIIETFDATSFGVAKDAVARHVERLAIRSVL